MKKICVVNPNYYQSSGVTKVIVKIYQGLNNNYPGEFGFYFIDCLYGSEVSKTPWLEKGSYKSLRLMSNNPLLLATEATRFLKWVKQEKINIIHIHHRRLLVIINFLLFFSKTKVVYTSHLNYSYNFFFKQLIRNDTYGISESVINNLQETTNSKLIKFVGNPIDFPLVPPSIDLETVQDYAITIGRLVPIKGHRYIIEAFRILKSRGVNKKLLILGEGPEERNIRDLINLYDLNESIEIIGYTDNVNHYINKALFCILHSSIEGLGLVVVEAAALGRPSIVTDIDGPRETVPPDSLLPNLQKFGDTEALANNLEQWFKQPTVVEKEGEKFFNHLKEKFSTPNVIKRYYEEYSKV